MTETMMNKGLVFIFLGCCLVTLSCKLIKSSKDTEFSERTYRDYVLYRCLEKALGAKIDFSDDLSLGIYEDVSKGSISNGAIARYLDSLVQKEVNSIYFPPKLPPDLSGDVAPSTEGRHAIFMSCIEYYNSKELCNDIKKLMKMKKIHDKNISEEIEKAAGKK